MKMGKAILIVALTLLLLLSAIPTSSSTALANEDQADKENTEETAESTDVEETEEETKSEQKANTEVKANNLPKDSDFQTVAENDNFILKADPKTGHFSVLNKKTENVFRSFPNPDAWDQGGTSDAWQSHLQSPFMFSYVEMNVRKDMVKESNFNNQQGTVDFKKIDNGFQITYDMPNIGFVIPIQVQLGKDFVETKVLSEGIQDVKEYKKDEKDPMIRLVSLRLFPFLGADSSEEEDGFLFLPDGSGVLIDFKKNRASTTDFYSERVYGEDLAFSANANLSSRLPVRMPIFGIRSGEQAILGIINEGDVYANIVSAPSESLSQYNWATAEHLYRFKVFQPTNKKKTDGYFTYTGDIQRTDRSTRYYMIENDDADYVEIAERYRQYLIEEQGIKVKDDKKENLDLQLSILGGGTKKGFLLDSFLSLTTMEQAKQIVQELNSLGVEDMSITYQGWQKGGYGKFGGHFPISNHLGGNDEMKDFVDFAHSKQFSVYLDASSYTYNNTGKDHFRESRDGLRDLYSSVIKYFRTGVETVFVSPLFMKKVIYNDLNKVNELGVDGYVYGDGIGSTLVTDYNDRYLASRSEVKEIQQDIFEKTKQELGDVRVASGNFYALNNSSHIEQMDNNYSYDLFVDRTVPFAQIALHGLVSYSFEYGNMSGNVKEAFLKGIEYGGSPAFLVTYEESNKLLESRSMRRFYSTYYKDWEAEIASQYQRFNEALADVQDQFITDHRMLANEVFETTYEKGKRIIVNYNDFPYTNEGITIEAEDFVVIEGGK
ncbi:DUF5696 domain-containing protein [Bacillus sp. FSL K6-3431]|uniref:DUF5696 domain-containing protein n=1 Tax=Bacillus sp. FSL K6-3431 TaxID=2921500 RepID=UPI0030F9B0DB